MAEKIGLKSSVSLKADLETSAFVLAEFLYAANLHLGPQLKHRGPAVVRGRGRGQPGPARGRPGWG